MTMEIVRWSIKMYGIRPMSDNRITFGHMAALKEPITDAETRDDVNEDLYWNNTGLFLNYEGTLVGSTTEDTDLANGFDIHLLKGGKKAFIRQCKEEGFEVDEKTVAKFVDLWYDGCDSTHASITLDEFKKKLD